MSNFVSIENRVIQQGIAVTDIVKNHELGEKVRAKDIASTGYGEGEFIYLLGVASTAVGSAVTVNMDNGSTALLAANAIGPVAFAMSANVAGQYGWYQVSGKAVGLVLAAFADNGNCYATATAGSMDDAIVAGDRVQGCKGASAIGTPATGQAELEISNPFTNNALAD